MKRELMFLFAIGLLVTTNRIFGQEPIKLSKGDIAYDFIEKDDEGNEVNLESYKGKVVLINFTATFCGPCWNTYNHMDELQKRYKEDLKIISFHLDEEKEIWKKTAKKKNINFDITSIWESNTKKEIFDIYGVNGFPYFVLIDEKGIVFKMWLGHNENKLERNLKKLIKRLN